MQHVTMNTAEAITSNEIVLWAGSTLVADDINGRFCTAKVTKDRDWVWIYFNQRPSEKYRQELTSVGFSFSKRRVAWHAIISELAVKKLNKWGVMTLTYQQLVSAMPVRPVEKVVGNLNVEDELPKTVVPTLPKSVQDALAAKAKADKAYEAALAKAKADEEKAAAKAAAKVATPTTKDAMTQMMELMAAQTQMLLAMQQEIASLKMASATQVSTPTPTIHMTNGNGHYKVAGINLG
jgi:hypothetical protein